MKHLLLTFALAFACVASSSAAPAPAASPAATNAAASAAGKRKPLDRSKIRAKHQKMIAERKARIEAEGGLIQTKTQGSVIGIFSTQKILDEAAVRAAGDAVSSRLRFPVEYRFVTEVTMADLVDTHYGALVLVGEYAGNQMLVLNPDRPMAVVDVKALAGDGAAKEVVSARLAKTVMRASYMALGAGVVSLGRVGSLKGLDANEVPFPPPDVHNAIMQGAAQLKIVPISFVTYKAACEAGWAPAPDTEIRKAVFARVKAERSASPKKGIKIEFDKAAGK